MKAQSIWIGHDYAYWRYRSRSYSYTPNIERVRVTRVEKVQEHYKKNKSTVVEVAFLDWDGNLLTDRHTEEVRAYDIVDFWDDYWAEHGEQLLKNKEWREQLERERIERQQQMQREREAREAAEAARRERLQHHRTRVINALLQKGVPYDPANYDVVLDHTATSITIRGKVLEDWLGLSEEVANPTNPQTQAPRYFDV